MPGEVSCRALRPLFRYVREHGLSPEALLAGRPSDQDLFDPDRWIPADQFAAILQRAADLLNDPDLPAHVGEAAATPCAFGILTPQAPLTGSPESLLGQAGTYLGLLQRESQVIVRECGPGKAVLEIIPAAGSPPRPEICIYTRHLLAAIPRIWGMPQAQVHELRCAVPPDEAARTRGREPEKEQDRQPQESIPRASAARGFQQADSTTPLGGTAYGADRCTYEVSWTAPQTGWQRLLARLNPLAALRGSLYSRFQRQQATIRELRREFRRLQRTTEARILERTEELRQKARQMALMEQTGRRFAGLLETESLAAEAVRTLREEFGYFTVALYLRAEEGLVLQALNTGDNTIVQAPGQKVPLPPEALERLHRAGRPLIENDLLARPHPLQLPRLGRARSSMTMALPAPEQPLGAIDVQSPRQDRFDDDDARILHTLATQAALALERSQLYHQERRARQQADAMATLSRVVNASLELNQVLPLVLDELRRILPYDAAAVVLLEDGQPVTAAGNGLPPHSAPDIRALFDAASHGPLARVLRQAESVYIGDCAQMLFPPQLASLASWLAVPLVSHGTTMGVFLLAARAPHAYTPPDLHRANDLAGQVATAIENARLYERIRRDRDRLEALYRIARELNADLEVEEVLRHILGPAQASVGAQGGSIILLDADGQPSHSILLRPGGEAPEVLREVLDRGAAGWVVRHRQGLLIRDTDADPRWIVLPGETRATRSAIIVPLAGQGQVIGALTVTHPQAGHFDENDLELLTSIADQASSVVQRAALFATVRGERARLETVIEGTADAVIVLDEAGKVLRVNRSAADLFGLEQQAAAGRPLPAAVPHPAIAALLDSNRHGRQRVEVPLEDGRTLYATLTPIPAVGAVITMQDITALKELDRIKSDFVANVSHDLRTPLGAVQGFAEMLELAGPLNEDQSHFVQRILHQVEAMTELVESLLDLAKIEAGVEMEMAPCQLAAVIAESVDQMASPAGMKAVQLQVSVAADLPLVWGNGRRLGQVVNNLLDNAIKYAPGGSQVALRAYVAGDAVRVDVSDQGPGIAAVDLPHLFEKFYRARKAESRPRGTGLGLSIAHSIITAHKGRIWAESVEGQGSTFSFTLPIGPEKGGVVRQ